MKQNLSLAPDAKRARLPDPVLASIRTSFSTPAARSKGFTALLEHSFLGQPSVFPAA